jgi:SAM-dependent methyltransferase
MSLTSRVGDLRVRELVRHYRPWAVLTRQLNTRYGGLPPSFFARSARIVDAGGGPQDALKAKRLFAQCWYEGINIEDLPPSSRVRGGYDRYHLVDLDGTDLRFLADRSYDLVVSSHTIEHLEDGAAVVTRLCAKVRRGGLLYLEWPSLECITFPFRGFGLRFDDDGTHRQTYGLDEIRSLVERQGLRVEFARRRRQWLRMILAPFLVGYHSVRLRRLVLYDVWDITGFCYTLRANRPIDG